MNSTCIPKAILHVNGKNWFNLENVTNPSRIWLHEIENCFRIVRKEDDKQP